jgi:L-threonylcarbamoyladenylate synthase
VIERAVQLLREGKLVAFPTETVYGLGADATNGAAIERIFAAKGRPSTNPLICHVADETMARRYASDWPAHASEVIRRFWPGPVTIVVRKTSEIPAQATAGRDTVGLRAPNHPLTLELIRTFGKPIAGPSANRSNHISPTTAQHVREELGDRVDLILDGGPCGVGIESTVVDLTGDVPTILRPGGVSREQLIDAIGPVELISQTIDPAQAAASPGQHAKHYAPRSPAYRITPQEATNADPSRGRYMLLSPSGTSPWITPMPRDPQQYAQMFYGTLRELDSTHPQAIFIELPPPTPEWTAVRDRILRATTTQPT